MSYWVYLGKSVEAIDNCEEGALCSVASHEEGGTYCVGGEDTAQLNVTYNYGVHIWKYLPKGLLWLDGKKAHRCIARLEKAVAELGDVPDDDYWAPTEGNAGHALAILLSWARQYPNAVFLVS